jgi:hypothetical protein
MGRHTSMKALYAVELTHEIATKIYQNHFNENCMAFAMNPSLFDDMTDDEFDNALSVINAQNSPYPGHNKNDHQVFDLMMATHSENPYREVSSIYDNDHVPHYFGITIADSGYRDKIGSFAGSIPQEAIDNFEKYAKPILDKYGVTETPEFVVTQSIE